MSDLLSRYGESIFWFGRYIERTACLARLLEVQASFDRGKAAGANQWSWILRLYDDQQRFLEAHGDPTTEKVIRFYISDRENMGSIVSSIRAARENARTLRALLPTELWHHVNVFYNRFRDLPPSMISDARVSQTCKIIKGESYALLGVADATLYRDTAWNFFQIGVLMERADQMSRLLDVRFAQMRDDANLDGDSLGDFGFWAVLLRAAAAHQVYLRYHPGRRSAEDVARFLIFDPALPRSIVCCVHELETVVTSLRRDYNLHNATQVLAKLYDIRSVLDIAINDRKLITELHSFNDQIQRDLVSLTNELSYQFFGLERPTATTMPPSDSFASTQSQSQS